MDRGCLREVSTSWQYQNLHKTTYKATLTGDVVEVNLQIKTTRGFHKVKRDAWGAHTHSYQRWGTQIQPTPTTARQISKFQKQWAEYLQRSTRQHALERDPKMAQQCSGGRIPRAYTFQMPGTNTRTPWIVRQAERGMLPSPRRTAPEPSPVAQPLSHMAQLAAGMLPLGNTTGQGQTVQQAAQPAVQPEAAMGAPPVTTPTRPATPPMTFPSSETTPLDLSCKQEKMAGLLSIKTSPITSDEEVPDLVEDSPGCTPVIQKVETISERQYNNLPEKHVRFQEPPKSPTPQRSEEEMEIQEPSTAKQDPPQEPEVLIISPKPDSDDSDGDKLRHEIQERTTAWEKRRARAQKKRLILRIRKNTMGPNTLEVYRGMPPTPVEAPAQLFPEVKLEGTSNGD